MEKKKKKILEGIYYIGLIVLICISITSIALLSFKKANIINIPENFTEEQLKIIDIVSQNNGISSISNIIAATAIFFTVLLVIISVFQFIKTKEFEQIQEETKNKMNELDVKISEYDRKMKSVEDRIEEEKVLKEDIKKNIDVTKAYIYKLRAEEEYKHAKINHLFFIDMYEKCIEILNKYNENLIEEYEISRIYINLGIAYMNIQNYDRAEKQLLKSLEYNDLPNDEISKRINLAYLYKIKSNYGDMFYYLEEAKKINSEGFKQELLIKIIDGHYFIEELESESIRGRFMKVTGCQINSNGDLLYDKELVRYKNNNVVNIRQFNN